MYHLPSWAFLTYLNSSSRARPAPEYAVPIRLPNSVNVQSLPEVCDYLIDHYKRMTPANRDGANVVEILQWGSPGGNANQYSLQESVILNLQVARNTQPGTLPYKGAPRPGFYLEIAVGLQGISQWRPDWVHRI